MSRTAHYLQRDWTNPKDITNEEIAEYIVEHGIPLSGVPEPRRDGVQKYVERIKAENSKRSTRQAIEKILEKEDIELKHEDGWIEIITHETNYPGYWLDPGLFDTVEQAEAAMQWLKYLGSSGHIYEMGFKDHKRHNERFKALEKKLQKCFDEYVALGGDKQAIAAINLPEPRPPAMKKWFDRHRQGIVDELISLGMSKTRAGKIAKEITQIAYSERKL